jgi:zinc transport system substrate-binding protein
MKKSITMIIIFVLVFTMTACGKKITKEETLSNTGKIEVNNEDTDLSGNDQEKDSDKLQIYASFYPLYDFAVKIGGDKVVVTNLVPAGVEPHDWEPSTKDMINLQAADILLYNGVGMEHWIDQVASSLENKNLILVEASQGINLLPGGAGEEEEKADTESKESAEDESGYDPHVWLSIKNAKLEMKNIKDALVKADPANTSYYEDNYITYAAKFDELDKEYKETLDLVINKNIVVAHKAFAYLCGDYGLTQVPIEGLSADSEPDAKRMSEIIKFAKENNVKTIFFEELVSPKVAETIAAEIGASTDVLNPLEGLTQEQVDQGEDYLSVMKENLETLKKALE